MHYIWYLCSLPRIWLSASHCLLLVVWGRFLVHNRICFAPLSIPPRLVSKNVPNTLVLILTYFSSYLPDNLFCVTAHFLLHGIHYYLAMDKSRLVMPPALFVILVTPFCHLAHVILFYSWHGGTAAYCGSVFGCICYDLTHYSISHYRLPLWYWRLKRNHLPHHFLNYELGFGVTTTVWDTVFGTQLQHDDGKQS